MECSKHNLFEAIKFTSPADLFDQGEGERHLGQVIVSPPFLKNEQKGILNTLLLGGG